MRLNFKPNQKQMLLDLEINPEASAEQIIAIMCIHIKSLDMLIKRKKVGFIPEDEDL